MNRKEFLCGAFATATLTGLSLSGSNADAKPLAAGAKKQAPRSSGALAISMWDFSWLERRWEGGGYEDWDRALDELCERGYNAVRIDAYPHLIHSDPHKEWTLVPVWNQLQWGAPDVTRVQVLPALLEFLAKCRERGVRVGLSTWFREDADNVRMRISGPEALAECWLRTLEAIRDAGLLDAVFYTDLCNEWPGDLWAPFLRPSLPWGDWKQPSSLQFMETAIVAVRARFPDMPLLFSLDNDRVEDALDHPLAFFDAFEHHVWAASQNGGEYNKEVGYHFERFDPVGFKNLSLHAEETYRKRPDYWQRLLVEKIDRLAAVSKKLHMPLMTTECWALVDYKDWPLLKWDWVKDLCRVGVERAAGSGQWAAVATSNFCGPQFVGMWREVSWHLEMTRLIRSSPVAPAVMLGRLGRRLAKPLQRET